MGKNWYLSLENMFKLDILFISDRKLFPIYLFHSFIKVKNEIMKIVSLESLFAVKSFRAFAACMAALIDPNFSVMVRFTFPLMLMRWQKCSSTKTSLINFQEKDSICIDPKSLKIVIKPCTLKYLTQRPKTDATPSGWQLIILFIWLINSFCKKYKGFWSLCIRSSFRQKKE